MVDAVRWPYGPESESESRRFEQLATHLRQTRSTGSQPIRVVRAPLRVCPLGAHVDHQGGRVTGMALDRSIHLALVPTEDGTISVDSLDFEGRVELQVGSSLAPRSGGWGDYLRGAVSALVRDHRLSRGMIGVVAGEMPIGGLSSSAAVTLAYLLALAWVNQLTLSQQQLVSLASWAENQYIGLASGTLDQSVILYSRATHLTSIDCSTADVACLPRAEGSPDFCILVVHSGVSRDLVATGYNERVKECREAARHLLAVAGRNSLPHARLSLVEPDLFLAEGGCLPAKLRRRAAHYFSEVSRVNAGIEAWQTGDIDRFGELVSESGASSIDSYECGSPHLITLYSLLRQAPGVYGARFSGGGFGGSCIALVDPDAVTEVAGLVRAEYPRAHPDQAERFSLHLCQSSDGARMLEMEL